MLIFILIFLQNGFQSINLFSSFGEKHSHFLFFYDFIILWSDFFFQSSRLLVHHKHNNWVWLEHMLSQCINIFKLSWQYFLIFYTGSEEFSFFLRINCLVIDNSNFIKIINASHTYIRRRSIILILIFFFVFVIFGGCLIILLIIIFWLIVLSVIFALKLFYECRYLIFSNY